MTAKTSPAGKPARDREAIRDFLTRRYNGVIPVTEAMIDAVIDGLSETEGD